MVMTTRLGLFLGLILTLAYLLVSDRMASATVMIEQKGGLRSTLDIPLLDHNGDTISLGQFSEQTVLVNFVFTGCNTYCPIQTGELSVLYDNLAQTVGEKNLRFVSVSLTPHYDTPEDLAFYRKAFSVDKPNWTFATGEPEDVEELLNRLNIRVLKGKRPKKDVLHDTQIHVIKPGENRPERFDGIPLDDNAIWEAVASQY